MKILMLKNIAVRYFPWTFFCGYQLRTQNGNGMSYNLCKLELGGWERWVASLVMVTAPNHRRSHMHPAINHENAPDPITSFDGGKHEKAKEKNTNSQTIALQDAGKATKWLTRTSTRAKNVIQHRSRQFIQRVVFERFYGGKKMCLKGNFENWREAGGGGEIQYSKLAA